MWIFICDVDKRKLNGAGASVLLAERFKVTRASKVVV